MNPQPRRIKSFVRREGRSSDKRKQRLEQLWPRLGINPDTGMVDFNILFDRQAPTFLEIGFGTGTALLEMATKNPGNNYLGVEVYRTGIGQLLSQVDDLGITNIRVFNDDAVDVLTHQIPDQSLDGLFLFFPDPWHKKRHHKRRLVQSGFIQLILKKLKPGGVFHAATDWEDYAHQMMAVLSDNAQIINSAGEHHFAERPEYRPYTKFERRGQSLGHGVWDLIFHRVTASS